MSNKQHLSLLICGHEDGVDGYILNRLVFHFGGLNEREMAKLEKLAEAHNKDPYNMYIDYRQSEQIRGRLALYMGDQEFFTDNYHYTITQKNDNKNFIKQVISDSKQVDVFLLLVPADKFTDEDVQTYTKRLVDIIYFIDTKHLIIGINGVEAENVNYDKNVYDDIKSKLVQMLSNVGLAQDVMISLIPMSGINGDNISNKSDKMPWCDCTLYDALNGIVIKPDDLMDRPIRLPLNGVYKIKGTGDVVTGCLEQGRLYTGQDVIFLPTHTSENPCIGKVKVLEMRHKQINKVTPGSNVGICIEGLSRNNKPRKGDIMVLSDDQLKPCKRFTCRAKVLGLPENFGIGSTFTGYVKTSIYEIKLVDIINKSDDIMNLEFESINPFVVEPFNVCSGLGRIAIYNNNDVCCMFGKIVDTKI